MNGHAAYSTNRPLDEDDIVERFGGLVKRIAHHVAGRLPSSVQVEDLIQAGMIGLLEAARNYNDSRGASFATYAGKRVRGAVLDEVRRSDWTPRSVHRKAREAAEAIRVIEHREGREAQDAEVAKELGIRLNEYNDILVDAVNSKLVTVDDADAVPSHDSALQRDQPTWAQSPLKQLESDRFRQGVVAAIESLPEREQLVMSLYYDEELNLREIGGVLGVSESRVCQIHGQALIRLRARLANWLAKDD
jgi:RNA polymerase sigma factor for flagellar operon FliA